MNFKEIGKKIAFLRKQKHLSQEFLSKELAISRATISSLENGRAVDIGLKKILQILDYLGYEVHLEKKSPFPSFEQLRDELKEEQ
ncbi:MAG: helix-turn-helix transcriptional regulator [Pseudomonadota bacterium]